MKILPCESNGLSINLPDKAKVVVVYISVDPYEPIGKLNIDYLNYGAISQFINSTHEKYKSHFSDDFGSVIKGTFMDETRFCNAVPWTKKLPEEFKKRKGYDIVPLLSLLFYDYKDSDYVRYDYFDVISDLYAQNTFGQIYNWCKENNLQATGHILGEETIAAQSYFGADVLRVFRYLHVPGLDHLGNGIGSLDAKFVSSAAHHYGKDRISCEAFGACGWDMTYEDMVRISNWLFQQGINHIIIHGFYYSIREERAQDFPPSYFFQWKYWDKMKEYVPMANRMMEMLSGGIPDIDILIYSPMETFWTCFKPDLSIKTFFPRPDSDLAKFTNNEPPEIKNDNAKYIDNQFQVICGRLLDENIDFEIIGGDAVKNFKIEDGHMMNTITGASYSILILPCVRILTLDMVLLIDLFTASNGLIISYHSEADLTIAKDGSHIRQKLPVVDKANFFVAENIDDIVNICRERSHPPFNIIQGTDRLSHSQSCYPDYLIDPYVHDGERIHGVGVTRYIKADYRIFNFTNYNENIEKLHVWIESNLGEKPEIFNPETGEVQSNIEYKVLNNGFEFDFLIPANRTLFIVCPNKQQ
jgi:hypothetical protein